MPDLRVSMKNLMYAYFVVDFCGRRLRETNADAHRCVPEGAGGPVSDARTGLTLSLFSQASRISSLSVTDIPVAACAGVVSHDVTNIETGDGGRRRGQGAEWAG